MSTTVSRSAVAWQESPPTDRGTRVPDDCRHSKTGFHTLFHPIAARRDISPVGKLVHQALVSMHRMGVSWTQTEIGEAVGLSRHQVWRALDELAAAGWVKVRRIGLGRPNEYELVGIDADDLKGRASARRPAAQPRAGHSGADRRDSYRKKENGERSRNTQADFSARNYLETRTGTLMRR